MDAGSSGKYRSLYRAKARFEMKFGKPNLVYVREDILENFLDYVGHRIELEEKRGHPDTGYIKKCREIIDEYAPVHENLKKKVSEALKEDELSFRKQLDDIRKKLDL